MDIKFFYIAYIQKVQILTVLPASWSASRIQREFECSYHMAKSAKELQNTKGILPNPDPKLPSNQLDPMIRYIVTKFYLNDEISREMPGKRDCISIVVDDDGRKENVQKRMMLCSLYPKRSLPRAQKTKPNCKGWTFLFCKLSTKNLYLPWK